MTAIILHTLLFADTLYEWGTSLAIYITRARNTHSITMPSCITEAQAEDKEEENIIIFKSICA